MTRAAADAADAGTVESLPAHVDAAVVATLYRTWRPRMARIRVLDLSAVTDLDSAGVALLRAVQAQQRALGVPAATLRGVPERYGALCAAHRIPAE